MKQMRETRKQLTEKRRAQKKKKHISKEKRWTDHCCTRSGFWVGFNEKVFVFQLLDCMSNKGGRVLKVCNFKHHCYNLITLGVLIRLNMTQTSLICKIPRQSFSCALHDDSQWKRRRRRRNNKQHLKNEAINKNSFRVEIESLCCKRIQSTLVLTH